MIDHVRLLAAMEKRMNITENIFFEFKQTNMLSIYSFLVKLILKNTFLIKLRLETLHY